MAASSLRPASRLTASGLVRVPSSPLVIGGDCRFANLDELVGLLDLPSGARGPLHVLAAAWARWGEETPGHLHGEFTFFVYDPVQGTVRLCRDEKPTKPLFFVHKPGEFIAFSNHPRPLLALDRVDPALDEVAFAAVATTASMDTLETGYRDLRRVPRAHTLTVTRDGVIKRHRWWTAAFRDAARGWTDRDCVDEARRLFDQVVREHYGDGRQRVGLLLSGGLDSLAIADSVLRQKLGPLVGYAVLDPAERCVWRRRGKIADQRPIVEMLQRRFPDFKVNVIPYSTAPGDADTLDRMRLTGLVSVAPHPSGMMEDARRVMKADGITVVLGGHGGNQTLTADGWHRLDDLRNSWNVLGLIWEVLCFSHRRGPHMVRALAGKVAPEWLWRLLRRKEAADSLKGLKDFLAPGVAADIVERYGQDDFWRVVRDTRANVLCSFQRDHAFLDGAFFHWRSHGMSLRTPLADRRIVDFALSLPANQFLRHGRTRWLIRRMLAGRLPDPILDDYRYGDDFSSFPSRAVVWRDSMRAVMPGLKSSRSARRVFDIDRVERSLNEEWSTLEPERFSMRDYRRISNLANTVMAARFLHMMDGGNG